MLKIKRHIRIALLTCCAALALPALAQEKTIRLIVPYAAGSATDIAARLLATELSNNLHQPVIVDNKPGANASVAASAMLQAPADGTSIMLVGAAPFVISPVVNPEDLLFNPARDFAIVSYGFAYPMVLVASPSSGVKSLQDLMQVMRKSKDPSFFGSVGPSSPIHLAGLMLGTYVKAPVEPVLYKSGTLATQDVMAGRLLFSFDAPSQTAEFIKAGRVVGIGVIDNTRLSQLPDLPTIAEAGLPEFTKDVNWSLWIGAFVRSGTPHPVMERLNAAIRASLGSAEAQPKLKTLGMQNMATLDLDATTRNYEQQRVRWESMLKSLGMAKTK